MKLTFKPFDGRHIDHVYVIDEDTGQRVGFIASQGTGFGGRGGIEISLFDGKYAITAHRYEECLGFVKGVETVLRHVEGVLRNMTSVSNPVSEKRGSTVA